jgi:hypothetical protein
MFLVPLFLALVIITTPITFIFDGPITHGLIMAVVAAPVAIVALRIRAGEAGFLLSAIRPMAIAATVPVIWMLFQVLPLQTAWLANPIWQSAASALGHPLGESISIDPGITLVSLARYLSVAAIAFIAAAVALDRQRAAEILFTLLTATTITASLALISKLGALVFLGQTARELASSGATESAGLGIILAATVTLYALERERTDGAAPGVPSIRFWVTIIACGFAALICCLAVFVNGTGQSFFAIAIGLATLTIAVIIRRYRLGPWGYSAVASVIFVVAVAIIALHPGKRIMDLTLAFANRTSSPLVAITQRILTDTRWAGTGAGTFSAIVPIYQDINELAIGSVAPTAAAAIAVEMGQPFLWVTLLAAITLTLTLLRGALGRGRDWFYSITGASSIVVITLMAFNGPGLFSTPVLVTVAATIGVAIAQRKSRSI